MKTKHRTKTKAERILARKRKEDARRSKEYRARQKSKKQAEGKSG